MSTPSSREAASHLSHPTYRPDIDGLRAVAVLSVVVFHAFPTLVPGGFIGVDIFFIISGFLISSIIFSNLEGGTFSLLEFYIRRVRRIFPALVLVLLASLGVGAWTLYAHEFAFLGKHAAGGAGFVSNIVLWKESGYFDSVIEKKPLMHLWSLAVEEQFYFFWPLMLMAVWARKWSKWNFVLVTAVVGALSFAANIYLIGPKPTAAFYLPITRFWELMMGGGLAYIQLHKPALLLAGRHLRSVLGLALVVAGLYLIDREKAFPGWWALLPTLGATLLISAGSHAVVNRHVLSQRLAVWFGLISYPIYLWHWPALSFARIVKGDELSVGVRLGAVAFTIAASWATYRFVEKRLRLGGHSNAKTLTLLGIMTAIGGVGFLAMQTDGFPQRPLPAREAMVTKAMGPHPSDSGIALCEKDYVFKPCKAAPNEPFKAMILGDSHAAHLHQGLIDVTRASIMAAGTCLPLSDVFMHATRNKTGHACADTNYVARNIQILKDTPSIDTVIISGFWRPVLDPQFNNLRERELWGEISLYATDEAENRLSAPEKVERGLARTIQTLLQMGKHVVLVQSNPDIDADFTDACLSHKAFLKGQSLPDCTIARGKALGQRAAEDLIVPHLARAFPQMTIYDPFDALCDQYNCYLLKDGVPLYMDSHHLSVFGSQKVAKGLSQACGAACAQP